VPARTLPGVPAPAPRMRGGAQQPGDAVL